MTTRLTYTLAQLRRLADSYCAGTGTTPTGLGRAICGGQNWAVIPRMMRGAGCQAHNAERASEFFDRHWPAGVAWPFGVPRADCAATAARGAVSCLADDAAEPPA